MSLKTAALFGLIVSASGAAVFLNATTGPFDSGRRISPSKKLFQTDGRHPETFRKLKTALEITLSSDFGEIPAGQAVEINASLNPGMDYQNVELEWRLGEGVRIIDGALNETIPFLARGAFSFRKIHVVFLDQLRNHQVHVVARFRENGNVLGSVAQFNSRPDLIEASNLPVPPPSAQTEPGPSKSGKSADHDEPPTPSPSKTRIVM